MTADARRPLGRQRLFRRHPRRGAPGVLGVGQLLLNQVVEALGISRPPEAAVDVAQRLQQLAEAVRAEAIELRRLFVEEEPARALVPASPRCSVPQDRAGTVPCHVARRLSGTPDRRQSPHQSHARTSLARPSRPGSGRSAAAIARCSAVPSPAAPAKKSLRTVSKSKTLAADGHGAQHHHHARQLGESHSEPPDRRLSAPSFPRPARADERHELSDERVCASCRDEPRLLDEVICGQSDPSEGVVERDDRAIVSGRA